VAPWNLPHQSYRLAHHRGSGSIVPEEETVSDNDPEHMLPLRAIAIVETGRLLVQHPGHQL
jgi:hypothetical protein